MRAGSGFSGLTLPPPKDGEPGRLAGVRIAKGAARQVQMTTELNKVEARQGDRRHMNMRVLFWGTAAAFVLLALLSAIWAASPS